MAKREILFRGKRKDNGEWITDSETYIRDGDGIWLSDENLNVVQVLPETIGQFTSLTDKNGVMIFEWDIVKAFDFIYVVMWDSVRAMFYLRDPVYRVTSDFYNYFGSDLTVIGNIHDNPDILKGGGNDG